MRTFASLYRTFRYDRPPVRRVELNSRTCGVSGLGLDILMSCGQSAATGMQYGTN